MKKRLLIGTICTLTTLTLFGCAGKPVDNTGSIDADISATASGTLSDSVSEDVNTTDITKETTEITTQSEENTEKEPQMNTDTITSNNPNWEVVAVTDITHSGHIEGFLNENYGISVGYAGLICYTTDGGATWTQASNSSMCRFSLDIIDENLAWCGGNGNQVRVSNDGGKNWSEVTDITLGGKHSNIDFLDEKTGWISNNKKLASTTDGGVTWTELTLPEEAKSIAAICVRTEKDGYFMTHDGLFYSTSDSGITWNQLGTIDIDSLGVISEMGTEGKLAKYDTTVADMTFFDENHAQIAFVGTVKDEGAKLWCITTSDGGNSWTIEEIGLEGEFAPNKVFMTNDGNYLTLGSLKKRTVVLKKAGE